MSLLEHEFHGHGTRERPAALANWKQWAGPDGQNVYGYPLFVAMATELNLEPGAQQAFTMLLADDRQPMADLARAGKHGRRDGGGGGAQARGADAGRDSDAGRPFSRFVNEYMSLQQQLVLRRGWPSNMRGVRDTAQDYTSVVAWYPSESRRVIAEILETERTDGWFVRQYSTTDGRKGRHDERPYVDSGLWVWGTRV